MWARSTASSATSRGKAVTNQDPDTSPTDGADDDHPRPAIVLHPPILFVLALGIGWATHWLVPLSLGPFPGQTVLGGALAALGVIPVAAAVVQFIRAGTNIPTYRPAVALVTDGLYRFSRNPIYAGLLTGLAGLALILDNPWLLALVPVCSVVLTLAVIRPEERHLAARFGADYRAYCARTRRWF